MAATTHCDVVVVGAGHNGLVAATLLARAGLAVTVCESAPVVGGACRTETPFPAAPGLRASTGAYLLGLMQPELLRLLDLDLPLVRRDPHYFMPTLDGRHLLLGGDREQTRVALATFFSDADARADEALGAELAALREDLAPAWLASPLSVEETAQRWIRPALRETFVAMVRGSAVDYLQRFGFASEEIVAMYAVTDGLPGLAGSPFTPGSGHNLLVHSMCRLPGAGGTWMVVRGGMGTVTSRLADAARAAGATIRTDCPVQAVLVEAGAAAGVRLPDDVELLAPTVLLATDPYRLPGLLGEALPASLGARITDWATKPGHTLKVNLATRELPTFTALPGKQGQHGTTVHLLPPPAADGSVLTAVRQACETALAGGLPDTPPLEWYLHSDLDPSLRDDAGRHSSALFVQGVPHEVAGSSWAVERDGYVAHLLDLVDAYAPGFSALVDDVSALAPPDIEAHFGITGGHIFHVDNAVSFTDRMPYRTGVAGVYAGAAGCFPAGSVIGSAGHNCAQEILADLGLPPAR